VNRPGGGARGPRATGDQEHARTHAPRDKSLLLHPRRMRGCWVQKQYLLGSGVLNGATVEFPPTAQAARAATVGVSTTPNGGNMFKTAAYTLQPDKWEYPGLRRRGTWASSHK